MFFRQDIFGIQLSIKKTFPAPILCPVPEVFKNFKGQVIKDIFVGKVDQEKGDPSLFFKLPHKVNLMPVDILEGKPVRGTFLGIKANRDPLDYANIIHCAFLAKISQRDMPGGFINTNRRYGCGNFLDQCQAVFKVLFVCPVNKVL